jgi:hypothetical protein
MQGMHYFFFYVMDIFFLKEKKEWMIIHRVKREKYRLKNVGLDC